jgi:23S rRNA (pseudouridine1915-N3)-methyltransferase
MPHYCFTFGESGCVIKLGKSNRGGIKVKFSDVKEAEWDSLRPYVDTCLLPVTGLTGNEPPWEATRALEQLRDALDCFEIPYRGRIVTYPAYHFIGQPDSLASLKQVCANLRDSGFAYVIVVTAKQQLEEALQQTGADLWFALPPQVLSESLDDITVQVSGQLQQLWLRRDGL